ncbi:MAG: hypothetical protein OEY78_03930 [Gammaproteobacteria bacterium]|nr:hypothetical protein [Gammaproteobacteria bacterium]
MQTSTTISTVNRLMTITAAIYFVTLSNLTLADENEQLDLALLDSTDKWQVNRLFQPTESQKKKEQQDGQIMIYDGLRDTTIAKALDSNFDRIQNMMFTRVVVTRLSGQPEVDEFGNAVVEDDGCDS